MLAVKKTKDGVFLLFAHNTDSFVSIHWPNTQIIESVSKKVQVLASMSSEDQRPVCVMSRSNTHGAIAQGGRISRYRR